MLKNQLQIKKIAFVYKMSSQNKIVWQSLSAYLYINYILVKNTDKLNNVNIIISIFIKKIKESFYKMFNQSILMLIIDIIKTRGRSKGRVGFS